jgi:hypothetical protein
MINLFEHLLAGGEGAIEGLIRERQQEGVTLEFKTKASATAGSLDRGDKKNLGRGLSAFANSQGGLQVWGIDARRERGDEVDCARGVKPITNIEQFKSDVLSLVGDILMPRHDGIRVEAVECSDGSGAGYLLVHVERSERRPHMSRAPEDGRYYRRAGGSTYPMEHGDIEDAFNRRRVPVLEASHRWGKPKSVLGSRAVRIEQILIGLRNTDVATARFPYLHVAPERNCSVDFGAGLETVVKRYPSEGQWERFAAGADDVVHPMDTLWLAALRVDIIRDEPTQRWLLGDRPISQAELAFSVRYGCLDAPMRTTRFRIGGSEIPGPWSA